ncbi:MAG: VOC family protein [Gemmatimonadota bacterium]|jgi:hypothetical protein
MSRHLGDIRQNGFVVRNIEATMKHWANELGIGPFLYLEEAPLAEFHYRGTPSAARASMAFCHAGPLQIELIQPLDHEPSMYDDFLRAGHEGLQHLGYLVDGYEDVVSRCLERGWEIGQSGSMQGVRFTYFDTEMHPGSVIEVIEGTPSARGFYAMLEERCRAWDGSDPIRRA